MKVHMATKISINYTEILNLGLYRGLPSEVILYTHCPPLFSLQPSLEEAYRMS
ncbi:hypothetical protein ACRRTK_023847 [Alexandromys fortis]